MQRGEEVLEKEEQEKIKSIFEHNTNVSEVEFVLSKDRFVLEIIYRKPCVNSSILMTTKRKESSWLSYNAIEYPFKKFNELSSKYLSASK